MTSRDGHRNSSDGSHLTLKEWVASAKEVEVERRREMRRMKREAKKEVDD